MTTPPTTRQFLKELQRWTGHCLLNAAPSFGIAVIWLELRSLSGIAAMLCAVATFIIGYAILTTVVTPLAVPKSLLGKALRMGLIVRGWISLVSCICVVIPYFLLFSPDLWCGLAATEIVQWIYRDIFHLPYSLEHAPMQAGFFAIYLTTLFEGLILSGLLFFFCFTALIIMTTLLRRRMIPHHWLIPPQ